MRVIAGRFGGRRLRSVRAPGLRPTADRVREALFSVLGGDVVDARVLELYAGTGALSLEALSRGARSATCVERDPRVARVLAANVAALEVEERVRIVRRDALAFARGLGDEPAFDVVFCDPPYDDPLDAIVRDVVERPWWTTVCALEHAAEREPPRPEGSIRSEVRRWGDTSVTLFRRS